jgi:hypothetical protein
MGDVEELRFKGGSEHLALLREIYAKTPARAVAHMYFDVKSSNFSRCASLCIRARYIVTRCIREICLDGHLAYRPPEVGLEKWMHARHAQRTPFAECEYPLHTI